MNKLIKEAIEILGSQTKLAEAMGMGVRQQDVWNWLNEKYEVKPKFAKRLGEVTNNKVPAYKFHSDVFDSPQVKKSA